jgi:hypothetical protein
LLVTRRQDAQFDQFDARRRFDNLPFGFEKRPAGFDAYASEPVVPKNLAKARERLSALKSMLEPIHLDVQCQDHGKGKEIELPDSGVLSRPFTAMHWDDWTYDQLAFHLFCAEISHAHEQAIPARGETRECLTSRVKALQGVLDDLVSEDHRAPVLEYMKYLDRAAQSRLRVDVTQAITAAESRLRQEISNGERMLASNQQDPWATVVYIGTGWNLVASESAAKNHSYERLLVLTKFAIDEALRTAKVSAPATHVFNDIALVFFCARTARFDPTSANPASIRRQYSRLTRGRSARRSGDGHLPAHLKPVRSKGAGRHEKDASRRGVVAMTIHEYKTQVLRLVRLKS